MSSKRIEDGEKNELNPRQERFCQLYARKEEFFGNGTQAYIEAYKPKREGNWYGAARAHASRLLTNGNILARINEVLEADGLNDRFVDRRLSFFITQLAYPAIALRAIREYNLLRGRYKKNDQPISGGKILRIGYGKPTSETKRDPL
jgi:hypothetical protein